MRFRLWGRVPLVNETGADIVKSALGRLAAETVAWLPQMVTPQAGATWRPVDDNQAIATISVTGSPVDIEITVDSEGRLMLISLDRWRPQSHAFERFGCIVTAERETECGIKVVGSAEVGWGVGTKRWDRERFLWFTLAEVNYLRDAPSSLHFDCEDRETTDTGRRGAP